MKSIFEKLMESENNLNDNFWKWFGDSKVVDSAGNPLVVYHGTKSWNEIHQFDNKKFDKNWIGVYGKGFYFTNDLPSANFYGGKVMHVYLHMTNPFYMDNFEEYFKVNIPKKPETFPSNLVPDLSKILKRKGFDGIIGSNTLYFRKNQGFEYVVFSPTQIKSINNQGTWNPNDPNIYK